MAVHHEEVQEAMSDVREVRASEQSDNLDRLLISNAEGPWYQSFIENIRELVNPPKLPPLELTSKPVAVKDIWSRDRKKRYSTLYSIGIHIGIVFLIILVGTNKAVQQKAKESISIFVPDLAPYEPPIAKQTKKAGGGGGGGDRSLIEASKGKLPRVAPKQFTPPMAVVNNPDPKLVMEPTLLIQPNTPLPQVNMAVLGNPLGALGLPSNGTGSGGGIGSGRGGGVGSGSGGGFGPGSGGGTGGGVYRIGGGVSDPVPIFKPEPEYSEEARKAKFQGAVMLSIIIDENGKTRDIRVIRPLGLGLDEKAIEAVLRWRFKPSLKDGRAVAVSANVEVNFRLL